MITKSLIVAPKIPKTDKFIPAAILIQLYDTIDNIRDLFYVMWHCETGVRISDIVGIKRKGRNRQMGQEVRNIDWENNRIYTWDHKKDDWRYVYFPTKVKSKLKLWLKERQNLQIRGRELFPYSEKTCGRILRRWCANVGFQHADKVGTHWCRHTFIRLSRRAGRDLKAVQQNTGDSIKTILEWYEALSPEDMTTELDKKPIVNCY